MDFRDFEALWAEIAAKQKWDEKEQLISLMAIIHTRDTDEDPDLIAYVLGVAELMPE